MELDALPLALPLPLGRVLKGGFSCSLGARAASLLFNLRYSSYHGMSGRDGEKAPPVSCLHRTKSFRPLPYNSTQFCDLF